jgi:hypothetical protein
VTLGRFTLLFPPLPGFQGIPIGVVFSAFALLLTISCCCFGRGFARWNTLGVDFSLGDDLLFNFEHTLEVSIRLWIVQAQVGSEIIFLRLGDTIFLRLGDA